MLARLLDLWVSSVWFGAGDRSFTVNKLKSALVLLWMKKQFAIRNITKP